MHNDGQGSVEAERFRADGVEWVRVIAAADAWIESEVDDEGRPRRYAPSRYLPASEWAGRKIGDPGAGQGP